MEQPLKKTLKLISQKNLKPETKWKYWLEKYLVWAMFFFLILGITACFAVVHFLANQLDWDLYSYEKIGYLRNALSLAPWIWILTMLLLVSVSLWNLRKTESGYRWNRKKLVLIFFLFAIPLGAVAATFGFGTSINDVLKKKIPVYSSLITTKESQWSRPQQGFLAGTIESLEGRRIDLIDLTGENWQLNLEKEIKIRPSVNLSEGEMIKTIGNVSGKNNFNVKEIRPWNGKGSGSSASHGNETKNRSKKNNHEQQRNGR